MQVYILLFRWLEILGLVGNPKLKPFSMMENFKLKVPTLSRGLPLGHNIDSCIRLADYGIADQPVLKTRNRRPFVWVSFVCM